MLRRGLGAGPSCYPGLWGWLYGWAQHLVVARSPRDMGPLPSGQEPHQGGRRVAPSVLSRTKVEIYPHVEDERWTAGVLTHTPDACGNVSEEAWGPPSADSLRLVCRSRTKRAALTRRSRGSLGHKRQAP